MKTRMNFLSLSAFVIIWSGCVTESFGPHDLDRKSSRAIVTDVMLRPMEKLESTNFQRVQVFKTASRDLAFDALIGPHPYVGDPVPPAKAKFLHSEPRVALEAGWVYAAGDCPYVEGGLVDATAGGSRATMIVWINEVNNDVYLFLLKKTGTEWAKVTLRSDPSKFKQWDFKYPYNNVERFVVFHPPNTFDDPQTISGPTRTLVDDIMGFAADANILDADR